MPDMPMSSTSPVKRPRNDSLADTITAVGQSIASALNPEAGSSSNATTSAQQVYKSKEQYNSETCVVLPKNAVNW